jgi:HPt (histidine-containing phosphotransfer) domain-containing protein
MANEPPIDFDQLNLVSNNDPYDREFLISIYLRETRKDLELLKTSIQMGAVNEVHRLSHGCAGSSMSYGMVAVVPMLRQIEKDALSGNLENAAANLQEVERQFERILAFVLTLPNQGDQAQAA